jgi:hypothetical protein
MDDETIDFKDLVIAARQRTTDGLLPPNVIPTEYKGVKFRSRLEAKWAVFFDTLGIEWEYELQGYEIGTGYGSHWPRYLFSDGDTVPLENQEAAEFHIKMAKDYRGVDLTILDVMEPLGSLDPDLEWYLPDFWLPGLEVWAEVKGKFWWEELRTTVRAIDGFSRGLPSTNLSSLKDPRNTVAGLLYLGNIPNPDRNSRTGSHVLFRNRKGVTPYEVKFVFNKENNRVELQEAGEFGDMFFDVYNCPDEKAIQDYYQYDLATLSKAVIRGLPREEKTKAERERERIWKFIGRDDVSRAVEIEKTEEELFAEDVLKAGWAAARNAQFR